jgi:hypothetical protein
VALHHGQCAGGSVGIAGQRQRVCVQDQELVGHAIGVIRLAFGSAVGFEVSARRTEPCQCGGQIAAVEGVRDRALGDVDDGPASVEVGPTDYEQLIAPTLQALAADDFLVLISTGGRPLDTLPPLPGNARAATCLPYDELLPRTAVYVTDGGYGGVQYALRFGVPIVATGSREDKPEVGPRVAWCGVGRRIRSERPTPRALRRDILAVLNQPRYRQASRRVAAEMSAASGFDGLADIIDRLSARSAQSASKNPEASTSGERPSTSTS